MAYLRSVDLQWTARDAASQNRLFSWVPSNCSEPPVDFTTGRLSTISELRPKSFFFAAKIVIAIATILIASVPAAALTWLS